MNPPTVTSVTPSERVVKPALPAAAIQTLRSILKKQSPEEFTATAAATQELFSKGISLSDYETACAFLGELADTGIPFRVLKSFLGGHMNEHGIPALSADISNQIRLSTGEYFGGGTDWYKPLFLGLPFPATEEKLLGECNDLCRKELQKILPIELWRDVKQPASGAGRITGLYGTSPASIHEHMKRFTSHEDRNDAHQMWNDHSLSYTSLLKIIDEVTDALFFFTDPLPFKVSEIYIPISVFVPQPEQPKRKGWQSKPKDPGHLLLRLYKTGDGEKDTATQIIQDGDDYIVPSEAAVIMKNITWWSTEK